MRKSDSWVAKIKWYPGFFYLPLIFMADYYTADLVSSLDAITLPGCSLQQK